ncbi:DUF3558 domain-containing protein [Nocardia sp. CA-290969]|uniref:DUF3558 domain-containing protein n=1 Tax=Nocardia sp. CA-290969 TaxID=3239986 RepID=UPI003D91614C
MVVSAVEVGMVTAGKRKAFIALVGGAVLALTGCESAPEGEAAESTPAMAPDAPTSYDPCTDIPQGVLDSENLRNKNDDDFSGGGVKWEGCGWVQPDGYAVGIQTTNLTLQMVRDKGYPGTVEFTISGRKAITSQRQETHTDASCNLNVEINGGSVEFGLSNPPSNRNTGHLDTCALARGLAEKVVPTIPAGV